jgi:hypothetical protein
MVRGNDPIVFHLIGVPSPGCLSSNAASSGIPEAFKVRSFPKIQNPRDRYGDARRRSWRTVIAGCRRKTPGEDVFSLTIERRGAANEEDEGEAGERSARKRSLSDGTMTSL